MMLTSSEEVSRDRCISLHIWCVSRCQQGYGRHPLQWSIQPQLYANAWDPYQNFTVNILLWYSGIVQLINQLPPMFDPSGAGPSCMHYHSNTIRPCPSFHYHTYSINVLAQPQPIPVTPSLPLHLLPSNLTPSPVVTLH